MRILTIKEEAELTQAQLLNYYKELREFLINSPHDKCLTLGSLSFCENINPIVRDILKMATNYEVTIDGYNNIKGLTAIYASTHQSKWDHANLVIANPNHTIILNSSVLSPLYKILINANGGVYLDKSIEESRKNAKLECMRLLLQNKSITMFPESAWNLSPNKLHLPFRWGAVDMAKKTGKPIVPYVQYYIYDYAKLDGKERIKEVRIRFGRPIYVKETDSLLEKNEELSTAFATLKWELMEEFGTFLKPDNNMDLYHDFLAFSIRNLKNAGIDLDVETQNIFKANSYFYEEHPINAVMDEKQYKILVKK